MTPGWWCKLAVMMDYNRWLIRQSGGDSYQPERSHESVVILSITNGLYYIPAVIKALVLGLNVVVAHDGEQRRVVGLTMVAMVIG